jgi:hypothetical protein
MSEKEQAQEHFKDRKQKVSGKFLLSEQQQWTRENVYNHTIDDIVAAHNPALAAEREKGRQEGYSEGWHRAVEELTAEAAKECGVDLYQGDAEYLERTKAEWLKQFNANKESG